jgi:hypothetical protein
MTILGLVQALSIGLALCRLLTLFGNNYDAKDPHRVLAEGLPIKWAGLAIPDPTTSAQPNYEASILLYTHILAAFQGVDAFQLTDHLKVLTFCSRREA